MKAFRSTTSCRRPWKPRSRQQLFRSLETRTSSTTSSSSADRRSSITRTTDDRAEPGLLFKRTSHEPAAGLAHTEPLNRSQQGMQRWSRDSMPAPFGRPRRDGQYHPPPARREPPALKGDARLRHNPVSSPQARYLERHPRHAQQDSSAMPEKQWSGLARRTRSDEGRAPVRFVSLNRAHAEADKPPERPPRRSAQERRRGYDGFRPPTSGADIADERSMRTPAPENRSASTPDWEWEQATTEQSDESRSRSRLGGTGGHRRHSSAHASNSARDGPTKAKKARPQRRSATDEEYDDDYDEDLAEMRRQRKAERRTQRAAEAEAAAAASGPVPILLPQFINVSNLAVALGLSVDGLLAQLAELGFEGITRDSIMAGETAALVAQEYGFEPAVDMADDVDLRPRPQANDYASLPPRPPVVTIMGHVDHGKTTILDWLRKTSVAAGEHGGITQHIGAFTFSMSSGREITFLDTPGHAAFLSMRQRGANVTDIVILVVAADDSVKPQTLEALRHARGAGVPIIVAINKIDKEEARVDQVKADLSRYGVEIEDYGGDVQVVAVSGRTGQGMEDLEENIYTLSEILDLRAEKDGLAEGWILESSIKAIGKIATVLVKRGTLRKGDCVLAGSTWARIRVLRNAAGEEVDEALPGTAVEVLGWRAAPEAGDQVLQAPDEDRAKAAAEYRAGLSDRAKVVADMEEQGRLQRTAAPGLASPDAPAAEPPDQAEADGGTKVINFTVKADVAGSVEAVCAAVTELGNNEVRPRVLTSAAGHVSESDVEHAAVSGSCIINFNNAISGHIKAMAKNAGVKIIDHTVIYHLVDDVKDALSEHLAPSISHRVLGEAEVAQIFPINIKGRVYKNIAGCKVRNGIISRTAKCRLMRAGEKVFDGSIEALKHVKKDISEARKGSECGISFHDWEDFRQGDLIQAYEVLTEKRLL